MKKCSNCGEYKEYELFHKSKKSKDGHRSWCKDCRKIETKKYREDNKDKVLDAKKEWYRKTKSISDLRSNKQLMLKEKKCTKCENVKSISDFRQRANGGYYSICKKCENENNKEYRKNNPVKINELRVIHENRRRYKKDLLDKSFNNSEWKYCKEYFNNECAYCGRHMKNLTQDHFIPLSNNGEYSKHNIIPCCRSCNSCKHNKNFYEWYEKYSHYSIDRINKIEEYFRSLK